MNEDTPVAVARESFLRSPWFPIVLTAVALGLWCALFANLLWAGFIDVVILYGAGPLALVGTIISIRGVVYRVRPRWAAIIGSVFGLGTAVYIAADFLRFLIFAAYP